MNLKKYYVPLFKSYSGIVFSHNLWLGIGLAILTFLNPNLGIGGFSALISAYLFARWAGFKKEFLRLEYYTYNPLLVGLALGYLFKVNFVSVSIFAIAGVFTFLVTYFLSNVCAYYLALPVLSVPFVISSSLFYLASLKFTNLFVISLYPHHPLNLLNLAWLPLILKGFFKSLGAIFFLPYVEVGILVFFFVLLASRILAFLCALGYLTGVLLKWILCGSYPQAVMDISAFNYILTAVAIGGVFLVPSLTSYRLACIAVALCVPVVEGAKVFWENFGIPVFALPFNAVTLLLLYVLISLRRKELTKIYKGSPERTLDYFMTYQKRFPAEGRYLFLPFSGKWTVWQGFDGEWTHKGPWRYAVDFVITDENGKTFQGEGYYLTDYYAFGKPVLSPVEGSVVEVVDSLPDNPPGKPDKKNNWGNYVLIYDKRGFYVLICHFKQGSVKVKAGDYVVPGQFLGLCGNSGYSPEPHIHIHVQTYAVVGSPTMPFSFSSYIEKERFVDIGVPKKGAKVEPVYPDKEISGKFNFAIDQKMKFRLESKGKEKEFELVVKMAPDGTFYFTEGTARLYFGTQNNTFYFYHLDGNPDSPLKYFLLALPKLPLYFREGMFWRDHLPLISITSKWKREVLLFLSSFKHGVFEVKWNGKFLGRDEVAGSIINMGKTLEVNVKFAKDFGFESLRIGDIRLIRIKSQGRER